MTNPSLTSLFQNSIFTILEPLTWVIVILLIFNLIFKDATEEKTTLSESLCFIRIRISENKDLGFIFKVSDINCWLKNTLIEV